MTTYTGHDLLQLGAEQGPQIPRILAIVNATPHGEVAVRAVIAGFAPPPVLPLRDEPAPMIVNLSPQDELEAANASAVEQTMREVLRTPVAVEGIVMPDACPTGPTGTIPVGGVVALDKAIAPGMHSADVCCSVALTALSGVTPATLMQAAFKGTHFGPGGRAEPLLSAEQVHAIVGDNALLNTQQMREAMRQHAGTQGDGNHFLFVGTRESDGMTCMVTHHGSRKPGALLFRAGMKLAERYRATLSPATLACNAWIPADSDDGRTYWDALQRVRRWTKLNHELIRSQTLAALPERGDEGAVTVVDEHWNEHNFVFHDPDTDLYWHAKGATPVHDPFVPDTDGRMIVPMNMVEPILVIRGERNERNRGFAPHGAGRNQSRTKHKRGLGERTDEQVFAEETADIDARFWCGRIDTSELPSAYKNAANVQADMERFGLADVIERILPHGSIMAGDWEHDAPWKKKLREKQQAKRGGRAA